MTSKEIKKADATPERRHDGAELLSPLVDIYQTEDDTTYVVAEMPAADKESLDIRVDKGVLTVEAEARVPEPGSDYSPTYVGFTGGRYYRAFALSDEVDRDRIEAALNDGVLTLKLPRAAAAQTRRIPVK